MSGKKQNSLLRGNEIPRKGYCFTAAIQYNYDSKFQYSEVAKAHKTTDVQVSQGLFAGISLVAKYQSRQPTAVSLFPPCCQNLYNDENMI